jgi:hypothetical protein
MLWELFQTSRIEQAKWSAARAEYSARDAQLDAKQLQSQVRVLEQQCERLTLVAMAMAEILRDRLVVSEYEIDARITEIDLRDGRLDGQLRAKPELCPKCRQTNAASRRHCLYCGAALTSSSFLFQSNPGSVDAEPSSEKMKEPTEKPRDAAPG